MRPDNHVILYQFASFISGLHFRKTGNPIRSLDLKLSCDMKVVPHGTRMRGPADRI